MGGISYEDILPYPYQGITLKPLDNTWMKILTSNPSIYDELYTFLSFKSESARFDPRVKNGSWDGNIHLLDRKSQTYIGLRSRIEEFAKDHHASIVIDRNRGGGQFDPWKETPVDTGEMSDILAQVKAKTGWDAHLYQVKAWHYALAHSRAVIVSPTGSGKSLIIYLILKSLCCRPSKSEVGLVIVPTTSLVLQMRDDFISYGYPADQIQILKGGESKILAPETSVLVSTWQSLILQPAEFLEKFGVCICDEVHRAKAKSITKIMTTLKAKVRIGTTGSLDDIKGNQMTIEGLFGPTVQYVTIEGLMGKGVLAKLSVHKHVLHYTKSEKTEFWNHQRTLIKAARNTENTGIKTAPYRHEMEWLIRHESRRKYIRKLIGSLTGNTLVLFDRVALDGVKLFDEMKRDHPNREVYLVHGKIDAADREVIRKAVIASTDAIVLASVQTFSTGINIPNLNNAVSIASTKSVVRILQSIGRTLRVTKDKTEADWYDIVDDLSSGIYINSALRQANSRAAIYAREKFNIDSININLCDMTEKNMTEMMV